MSKKKPTESVLGHQFGTFYKIPIDKFFQFALSVDCIILGYHENALKLLVVERGTEPHKGKVALPGDLVYPTEDMDAAAIRVLRELTGLENVYMTQSHAYGQVDRHPIGRVVTVGYYSLISVDRYQPLANSWADNVYWVDIHNLPPLAFDHQKIVESAIDDLKERVKLHPIGFELLPEKFTLGQMQQLYEAILGIQFDKANFRKKILAMNILNDTKEMQSDVAHRPARLFSFDKEAYLNRQMSEQAFEL